ncbi:MAG: hypothetical protein sL5_03850 [Candidatus Mesenet longicola]|uniref:Uncharacterized protein n=1 Tax=Candidatus Mesenet longicola TaxID=1892558 RepID=A0A8J3HUC3_9RICK|nr:MAG: hypothetical protein sGL2_03640 [Candidatus Mesenet longicola]GHM59392.1 MAG: hypothetical protein sL5_03850 [Candidatus Mesenet longicola]
MPNKEGRRNKRERGNKSSSTKQQGNVSSQKNPISKESLDEDIEQENQANVDNAQVGQDSGFKEPPFSEYSESDVAETEVANTDNVHAELDSDDKNKSIEQTSKTHNEIKVDQVSTVQSPVSTEADYATPLEHSESGDTETINNDGNFIGQEDDTDNDTDERELEDNPESEKVKEGNDLTQSQINKNKVEGVNLKSQNTGDEDLSADDINKLNAESLHKSDDTSKPELKEKENEHEIENIKTQPREVFLSDDSDGESLTDDNPDSSTPHTQTSRMSEDSSISNGVNHNTSKKKVFKSSFANFSKGEKALLFFVALSSTAFIASLISSALGKPLCPDKKGNLISLAILGTVAIISVAVSLVHFHYPDKSKGESLPLDTFGDSEVVQVLENKKNR